MVLENYKIEKIDKLNYRIMEFKSSKYKKVLHGYVSEEIVTEPRWQYILGYYPRLDACLDALKEYLVSKMIDLPYVELKAKIEALKNAYVSVKINVKEEE